MITTVLEQYNNGNLTLEDALLEAENIRKQLEQELDALLNFKHEKSNEINLVAQEYEDGYKGFKFEVRNGRMTYNFKGIDEWEEANKTKQSIEKKYKAFLNAKINGAVHANVSKDGEELQLPTISYGKPSVLIKEITE